MYYSSIGLLAAIVLLIENNDILFRGGGNANPAMRSYAKFLYAVLAYYVTDLFWGILNSYKLMAALFADTTLYFIAMALALLYWTRFVTTYLEEGSVYRKALSVIGRVFFSVFIAVILLNCVKPVLFRFDEAGEYHAAIARNVLLQAQIVLFLLSSAYAALNIARTEGSIKRRYRMIFMFGVIMAVFIAIQFYYPLLPLYAAGYMLGTCLLHAFVVNDEKDEYKRGLEESLQREKTQNEQLKSTWKLAYTDALTGVKSKLAYVESEEQKDRDIASGAAKEFAVAVFDINDLKEINDRMGHEVGDDYIKSAAGLICGCFKHSPVFRIGGDEFAVLIEGADYENRHSLKEGFDRKMDDPGRKGQVMVALGMADYAPGYDKSLNNVFSRADHNMYLRKQELKVGR